MDSPANACARLEHPRATVTIEGEPGSRRLVTVHPRVAGLVAQRSPCRTSYPDELIAKLLVVKGPEYLCDEIARDEDEKYAGVNIDIGLFSYLQAADFAGRSLLDFGCGCGSSTMLLARRLPETRLCGVELLAESLEIARLRAKHYGRPDIEFIVSPDGNTLPGLPDSFDFIVLNAVFEHLLPGERGPLMAQLWARLAPGGVLFLQETPNRWCPVEMHTTGLPLLNYLPDGLAWRASRRWASRVAADASWEHLLREGVRGGSVRQILRLLPRASGQAELLPPRWPAPGGQADLWYRASRARHGDSRAKDLARRALKIARAVTTIDFTPELALAIRKRAPGAPA
jgi:SAM-dependent methyltransferase